MRRKLLALSLVLCLVLPLIPAVTLDVASAETTKTYRLVTSVEELQDGCIYLLVNTDEAGVGKALSKQNTINRSAVDVTITTDRTIVLTEDQIAFYNNEDKVFQLTLGGSTGEWSFYIESAGYLFNPPSNNQLKTQGTNNDNSKFTISFENTDVNIISSSGRYLCYDEDSNVYSCYAEDDIGDKDSFLCLYRYDADAGIDDPPVTPSPTAEPTATPEPSPTAEPNDSKTYVLVTEEKELASGSTYLIASSGESGEAYVMSKQNVNTRSAYEVTVSDDSTIVLNTSEIASSNNDSTAFELKLEGSTDAWALFDPINGYLYSTYNGDYLNSSPEQTCTFTIRYNSGSVAAMISSTNGTDQDDLQFNDNNKVFSCYEGGKQPVYLYKLVDGTEPPADKPVFMSESLVLSGQIGVNFYMDLSMLQQDQMKDCFMEFTIGTDKKPVIQRVYYNESIKNPTGEYDGFTCKVNAIQMADPIEATFHYKAEDGTEQTVSRDTQFTVRMYIAKCMLDSTTTKAEKTLASSLADYGHFVQIYLSELRNWVLGEDYTTIYSYGEDENSPETHFGSEKVEQIKNALNGYSIDRTNQSEAIERITYSLVLDSETAIRVYFKMKDGYEGTFAVTLDDNAYTAKNVGGRYLVEIKGISAHKLGVKHTIDVQTDDNGSAHVEVSALSYVKSMLEQKTGETDADIKARDAVCAIYYYHSAAQALLNQ